MMRWIAVLLVPMPACAVSTAVAQPPNAVAPVPQQIGRHGGQMHRADEFQLETVFSARSVEVYVYDRAGEPVSTRNVRGRVTFQWKGDPRKYRHDLYPLAGDGGPVNGLRLAFDLSGVPDRATVVEFALYGLVPQSVAFAAPFQRRLTAEQIAISQQRSCPVSGKPLGSMGAPTKVKIGAQDVYVCCTGCIKAVREQPEEFLDKVATLRKRASQSLRR